MNKRIITKQSKEPRNTFLQNYQLQNSVKRNYGINWIITNSFTIFKKRRLLLSHI